MASLLIIPAYRPVNRDQNQKDVARIVIDAAFSPDLNPCYYWLWGFLKDCMYQGHVTYKVELNARIVLYVLWATSRVPVDGAAIASDVRESSCREQ
ncbi:hypothetical protein AVEN_73982-1 [Araneus ventricosus]|uniref:Uncharacterized protein n=1 Tax=Araneus ventricosus TaxID=182803 RepID=A0A4Y2DSU1_ARAVE|nr:hypothetical protein AVEN_73982-1 [Araneus ventricosus]